MPKIYENLATTTGPISEAIQHQPQILIVVTRLSTYCMCTKFQRNLKWVVIFHVEHLWNDPHTKLPFLPRDQRPYKNAINTLCSVARYVKCHCYAQLIKRGPHP